MISDNVEKDKINALYEECNQKANRFYDFVFYYNKFMQKKKDYGGGFALRMSEAHVLTYIFMHPGITVTQLAREFNRTSSAISQTVTSLLNQGFVEKRMMDHNKKELLLYATDTGSCCAQTHQMYDIADVAGTTDRLLKSCTAAEIDTFYKVLDCYLEIVREES